MQHKAHQEAKRLCDTLSWIPSDHPWPIVLGIDPGTLVLGYGAIVLRDKRPRFLAAGVLRLPRKLGIAERLGRIRRDLDELLRLLKPKVLVLEQAFASINIQSALRIGEARGVVLASSACAGVEVVQYSPASAKKALVGNGAADKTQVAKMVAATLSLEEAPASLDSSDALALALTYVHEQRWASTLNRSKGKACR